MQKNTISCLRDKKHGQGIVYGGVFLICGVCTFLGMEKHVPFVCILLDTEKATVPSLLFLHVCLFAWYVLWCPVSVFTFCA